MAIQIVDDAGFRSKVLDSSQLVLVDFYADWCGPCKMMAPVLEKVADQFADKVLFLKLNTDDSPQTAQDYQVRGIPTLLLFQAGQPIERKVGFINEAELTELIEKHVNPKG
jgi:thioredoxin 1